MDFLFGDIDAFLHAVGILGIFFILFAESGLLIGVILPGDTLLFTAGFLASKEYFDIVLLIIAAFSGAVLGDSFGYAFGKRMGPTIFKREDSLIFHKKNLLRAERFYERYGGMTLIYARFLPVVRTFAPILAGVGKMTYSKFLFFNVIGGLLWAVGLTLAGYILGNTIPGIDAYIPLIIAIVAISTVFPPLIHLLLKNESREEIMRIIKEKIFRKEPTRNI